MLKEIKLKGLEKKRIKWSEKSKRKCELFQQEIYKSNIPINEKQFILSLLPSNIGSCTTKKSYNRFIRSLKDFRKLIDKYKDTKEINSFLNYLNILELPIEGIYNIKSIEFQYKNLCKKYHPDINHSSEERFKEINHAYEEIKKHMKSMY